MFFSWFEIYCRLSVVSARAFPCNKFEYATSVGTHQILNAVCDLRVESGQQNLHTQRRENEVRMTITGIWGSMFWHIAGVSFIIFFNMRMGQYSLLYVLST